MTVYISTPVNGRPEPTFEEKFAAAKERVSYITELLLSLPYYRNAQFVSTIDLNPIEEHVTEAVAMGRCIQALLESDMVYFDSDWRISRGCTAEFYVAMTYNIESVKDYNIQKYLGL